MVEQVLDKKQSLLASWGKKESQALDEWSRASGFTQTDALEKEERKERTLKIICNKQPQAKQRGSGRWNAAGFWSDEGRRAAIHRHPPSFGNLSEGSEAPPPPSPDLQHTPPPFTELLGSVQETVCVGGLDCACGEHHETVDTPTLQWVRWSETICVCTCACIFVHLLSVFLRLPFPLLVAACSAVCGDSW